MIKVVYPSAGHNDKDPGAVQNGYKEADLTKELRNLVSQNLTKQNHKHIMDYDWETNSSHQKRIKPGKGSVLLDHHFDSSTNPKASGCGTFVATFANQNSINLGKELSAGIAEILQIPDRGVKTEKQSNRGRIGILHTAAGIAVLLEVCFISNLSDLNKYLAKKNEVAAFIAKLLIKYDNLT